MDSRNTRQHKASGERQEDWPEEVYAISLEAMSLLGTRKGGNGTVGGQTL